MLASAPIVTIENSTIADNVVDARGEPGQEGGEIYGAGILMVPVPLPEEAEGTTLIANSTISGNTALAAGGAGGIDGYAQGGGILYLGSGSVRNSLVQDTIAANAIQSGTNGTAQGGGVGTISIFNETRLAIASSTIAGNSASGTPGAGNGGNVFAGGFYKFLGRPEFNGPTRISFADTIVANGVGGSGTENCMTEKGEGTLVSLGFNLDSRDQCGFHAAGDLIGKNPLLGPLQKNGGPTATLLPAPNSPVVDKGAAPGLKADQRGAFRPFDFAAIPNSTAAGADGSDIGAVELQAEGR